MILHPLRLSNLRHSQIQAHQLCHQPQPAPTPPDCEPTGNGPVPGAGEEEEAGMWAGRRLACGNLATSKKQGPRRRRSPGGRIRALGERCKARRLFYSARGEEYQQINGCKLASYLQKPPASASKNIPAKCNFPCRKRRKPSPLLCWDGHGAVGRSFGGTGTKRRTRRCGTGTTWSATAQGERLDQPSSAVRLGLDRAGRAPFIQVRPFPDPCSR